MISRHSARGIAPAAKSFLLKVHSRTPPVKISDDETKGPGTVRDSLEIYTRKVEITLAGRDEGRARTRKDVSVLRAARYIPKLNSTLAATDNASGLAVYTDTNLI